MERGFISYLNDTETSALASLKIDLEELYEAELSWDLITGNPSAWRALLRKHIHHKTETRTALGAYESSQLKGSRPHT